MDLSICILTHDQPVLLPQCVAACLSEIRRAQLDAEIIVIDNASHDAYPQRLVSMSPIIRILRNEQNLGFSAGNNGAIRISQGRCVLILNDDAILCEGSLRLLCEGLDSRPRAAAVGPKFVNLDGSLQRGFTNARFPRLRHIICQAFMLDRFLEKNEWMRDALTVNRNPEQSGETEHLAAACILVRREALDAIGMFDESFYYFAEDLDLCYRLKQAGWGVVYLADVKVAHYGSASLKKLSDSERTAIYFKSLLQFCNKHWNPWKYQLVRFTLGFAFLAVLSERAVSGIVRRRISCEEAVIKAHARLHFLRSVLGLEATRETPGAPPRD